MMKPVKKRGAEALIALRPKCFASTLPGLRFSYNVADAAP